MKTTTAALLFAALIGGSVLATSADARGGHGGRGGHFGHHHGARVGVFVGAPLFFSPFYYPPAYYPPVYPRYYYYPSAVAGPASAPVYIEQSAGEGVPPAAAAEGGGYWYYCRDSQTYYPYVQQCASAWERVVPNSAPPR
jgi:hypothetical protein